MLLLRLLWSSHTGEWVPQTFVPGQLDGKTASPPFCINRYLTKTQIKSYATGQHACHIPLQRHNSTFFFTAPVQFNISRIGKEPQQLSKIRDSLCHAANITRARMVGSWWMCKWSMWIAIFVPVFWTSTAILFWAYSSFVYEKTSYHPGGSRSSHSGWESRSRLSVGDLRSSSRTQYTRGSQPSGCEYWFVILRAQQQSVPEKNALL